jgi:hypothetical protein
MSTIDELSIASGAEKLEKNRKSHRVLRGGAWPMVVLM